MAGTVYIDEDECIGCGTCEEVCPEVFELDDASEKAQVINQDGPEDCIEEAISSCPVSCISWK